MHPDRMAGSVIDFEHRHVGQSDEALAHARSVDLHRGLGASTDGLVEQLNEARQRGWLGEIERLEHILAAVDHKLDEIQRAERRLSIVEGAVVRAPSARLST
jgi:hypothetical protein